MPVIIINFENKKVGDYTVVIGQHCTIGRKSGNDIVLENLAVSGFHAQIDSVSTTFVLRDLDSTNGTYVNNEKVTMHNLNHEDVILIGKHELVFDCSDILRMKASQSGLYADAETRILHRNKFNEIMEEEEGLVVDSSPELETFDGVEKQYGAFFSRLWRKIFG